MRQGHTTATATTSTVATHIDHRLDALLAELADLPNVAREWSTLSETTRASVELDWDHLLADYLPELQCYHRTGDMSAEQGARYQQMLDLLRQSSTTLTQLGLRTSTPAGDPDASSS
jgi:hypothetical protein